jgi:hypothetical protein
MNINTYLIKVALLRAAFYHFILCESVAKFRMEEDVFKHLAEFLSIVPPRPKVPANYVLPTVADADLALQAQLELQRQSEAKSSSPFASAHDAQI